MMVDRQLVASGVVASARHLRQGSRGPRSARQGARGLRPAGARINGPTDAAEGSPNPVPRYNTSVAPYRRNHRIWAR